MTLSQEIVIKLCEMDTKTHIYEIWYMNQSFKQIIFSKYAMNLKITITKKILHSLGMLLI